MLGDEPCGELSLSGALAQTGIRLVPVETPEDALDRVRRKLAEALLIDARRAPHEAVQACAQIRALPAGAALPILVITPGSDLDAIEASYRAGATDFVTAPVDCAVLALRVRHVLRASQRAEGEDPGLRGMVKRVLDSVPVRVFWKDTDLRYLGGNRAFSEDAGLASPRDLPGLTDADLSWSAQADLFEREEHEVIRTHRPRFAYEQSRQCSDGRRLDVQTNTVPLYSRHGRVLGVLGTYEDITARKKVEARAQFLAQRDTLTGLPNRALFEDRLRHAIDKADRGERLLGLIFIDLDHLKGVNDTLGHHKGDELLIQAAERLRGCVRRSDTVARLAGDEFTVLLEMLDRVEHCTAVADKILHAFRKPFQLNGQTVFATASIGISVYPLAGDNDHDLLRRADTAMYRAKKAGRNRYRLYSAEMDADVMLRLETENTLRAALDQEQFELWYQPQYDTTTHAVVGFEALLRWNHPERGVLLPEQFLPLLEETGFIVPVGEWALREACRRAAAWRDQGEEPARVAVNLSTHQVNDPELVQKVTEALGEAGLEPSRLELEVTETCLVQDYEGVGAILERLKAMGVKVALDDFGTGYQSLNFLKHFSLDTLKIDRLFIEGLPDDTDDVAITTAIIALARNLNLRIVAEGVESEAQLAHLRAQGCTAAQGFLMSRPRPLKDVWAPAEPGEWSGAPKAPV
jgi:diguanylate cyclase (GGDEF)-like protein/PAS domain S-box-containing protein